MDFDKYRSKCLFNHKMYDKCLNRHNSSEVKNELFSEFKICAEKYCPELNKYFKTKTNNIDKTVICKNKKNENKKNKKSKVRKQKTLF